MIAHLLQCMPEYNTKRTLCIQASAKLPPERIRASKHLLERDDIATVSRHQTKAHVPLVGGSSEIVGQFFEKGQVGKLQILRVINDDTFHLC